MTNITCPVCAQPNFPNIEMLRHKLITVATQTITCPICQESLLGLDKFTIHLFAHMPTEPNNNQTTTTTTTTISAEDLGFLTSLDTQNFHPPAEKKLVCDKCNLELADESLMAIHKELVHIPDNNNLENSERFVCQICQKRFKMRGSLLVHLRVAHAQGLPNAEERSFQCALCPKSFKKDQHLGQHLKTHEAKQWQCETCSKYFTTKYFLKKHQRLHTGEMPYSCEICKKAFTFQQSYHKHLLYHSADKPHECPQCKRAFKELSTLHNHQRIHSGEKPFGCPTCGKCFRQRVSYIVHQRIHTGVLPYQCTACKKKFRYKVSQRSHKCTVQPPGIVIRQPGELIERLLQHRSEILNQHSSPSSENPIKDSNEDFIKKLMDIKMDNGPASTLDLFQNNRPDNLISADQQLSIYNI